MLRPIFNTYHIKKKKKNDLWDTKCWQLSFHNFKISFTVHVNIFIFCIFIFIYIYILIDNLIIYINNLII